MHTYVIVFTFFPVALYDLRLLDYRKFKYFKTFVAWEGGGGAYLSTEMQSET